MHNCSDEVELVRPVAGGRTVMSLHIRRSHRSTAVGQTRTRRGLLQRAPRPAGSRRPCTFGTPLYVTLR